VPIVARRIVIDNVDLRELDVRAGDFAQDQLAEAMDDERALRGVAIPLLEQARDRRRSRSASTSRTRTPSPTC
jgi:hypothetical protein